MATGRLEIHGTIDLAQFWPWGKSDADTTSIELDVDKDSFHFAASPTVAAKATDAFEGAQVRVQGQGSKEVVRTLKTTGQRKITVRLQGVDAPELHLRVTPFVRRKDMTSEQSDAWDSVMGEYRQLQAETATLALAKHLGAETEDSVAVRFETYVDEPGDAIDAYGRFVGDLYVVRANRDENVNQWLIANGWGVVAFYNSMSATEIQTLRELSVTARKKNARKRYDADAKFDRSLVYRPMPRDVELDDHVDEAADDGGYVMPKVFRRLAQFATNKKARLISGTFHAYLESRTEIVYDTDDFLTHGVFAATPIHFHDQFEKGTLRVAPEDLVYHERKARLFDAQGKQPEWFRGESAPTRSTRRSAPRSRSR